MTDNPNANCITGVGLWDAAGNLKAVLQSHTKTDEKFLEGLNSYDLNKIVCCCKGSYSLNREITELSFFHLLGRYDTGVSPAAKFGSPNEDADGFVNKLHKIMLKNKELTSKKEGDLKPEDKKLLKLYNLLIEKISSTTLEHQLLGQSTENLLTFKVNDMNPLEFTKKSLEDAEKSNIEAEQKCIPRFRKLKEFLQHFETKDRRDSNASDATTADLSDTETNTSAKSSNSVTNLAKLSLDDLRKEYEIAEQKLKNAFNAKDCRELKKLIEYYKVSISSFKKRCTKTFGFGCKKEDTIIKLFEDILKNSVLRIRYFRLLVVIQ
jgi:hypothetical protein